MMNFFKRFFKTNPLVEPVRGPVAGEKWLFVYDRNDPFPPKKMYAPVVILDVKDGWVRYSINSTWSDERCTLSQFLYMYVPYEEND